MQCPFYSGERENVFEELEFLNINSNDQEQTFIVLMSNMDNDVCSIVSNFINICSKRSS